MVLLDCRMQSTNKTDLLGPGEQHTQVPRSSGLAPCSIQRGQRRGRNSGEIVAGGSGVDDPPAFGVCRILHISDVVRAATSPR